jgi:hypothetical protein
LLKLFWWASTGYRWLPIQLALSALLLTSLGTTISIVAAGLVATVAEAGAGAGTVRVRPPMLLEKTLLGKKRFQELQHLPGVAAVYPERWLSTPSGIEVELPGRALYTEAAVLGIDPKAVELSEFDYQPQKPVPGLAPRLLLTVYNSGYAPANGLPRVTPGMLKGLPFSLRINRVRYKAVAAGVSSYGNILALLVPIAAVYAWEQSDEPESALIEYQEGVSPDLKALEALGLSVEELGLPVRAMQSLVEVASGAVWAVLLLILGGSWLLIGQLHRLQLLQRNGEFRCLQAWGLSRKKLVLFLIAEWGGGVGLGCVGGFLLGLLGAWLLGGSLSRQLEELAGLEVQLVWGLEVLLLPLVIGLVGFLSGLPRCFRAG